MPLPFAFSTQHQPSEAVLAQAAKDVPRFEGMRQPPANISTEPLKNSLGAPPSSVENRSHYPVADDKTIIGSLPPAPSPNLRLAPASDDLKPVTHLRAPSSPLPSASVMEDFSAQLEQLRNDVFGIAMSVSALNDRLDRLEQRAPQGAHLQSAITTMQGQIETWLESHLGSAVEHCLHRLMPASPSSPPPADS